MENRYLDKDKIAQQVKSGKHRDVIGGNWDIIGPLQFNFLVSQGLSPEHVLLDIGCGCLRAGVHLVPYLHAGNYCGLDLNQSLLDAGLSELEEKGFSSKISKSQLLCDDKFNFSHFEKKFNYAIAQSVFTHIPLNHIQMCLWRLQKVMNPGGLFFATFFEIQDSQYLDKPFAHPNGVKTYPYCDPYHYRLEDIKSLCSGMPWRVTYIGDWEHPLDQKMLLFEKMKYPDKAISCAGAVPRLTFEYEGPDELRANQLFSARLIFTASNDLHPGDRIVFAGRHFSDLGKAQMDNPESENYISLQSPIKCKLGTSNEIKRHPWNTGIDLMITDGILRAGERIVITLGDTEKGCPGFRCQSFAESEFRLRLGVFFSSRNEWLVLGAEDCPVLRVTGNLVKNIRAIISKPTAKHNSIRVHIRAEDAFGNIAHFLPKDTLYLLDKNLPLKEVKLKPGSPTVFNLEVTSLNKVRKLTVASKDGHVWSKSNPFGPSPMKDYSLFFGDIHGHSMLCDGTNSPAENYDYAKRTAGLDFAAITSHDFELTADDWKTVQQATEDAYKPGEFVTFLGYEWSGKHDAGGDHNIYFLHSEGPLVYSSKFGIYEAWDPAKGQVTDSRTLSETISELSEHTIMVVPHCGGRRCNLDFYDPTVMPLFELHSCHRTHEHIANETIRRKLRFGFIGGSDDHRGALGYSLPAARDRYYSSQGGLVAAYARDLTRESLWEAFFARRTYATNGPRIVLAVEIDGKPMGSEITATPGAALNLRFSTWLDGMLDRIEIMQDETIFKTIYPSTNRVENLTGEVELYAPKSLTAYYLKVHQADGGRAWSSPIWVIPEEDSIPTSYT